MICLTIPPHCPYRYQILLTNHFSISFCKLGLMDSKLVSLEVSPFILFHPQPCEEVTHYTFSYSINIFVYSNADRELMCSHPIIFGISFALLIIKHVFCISNSILISHNTLVQDCSSLSPPITYKTLANVS